MTIKLSKAFAMAVVMCFAMFSVAFAATPIQVNADNVNLRNAANPEAEVISTLKKGDTVNLVEENGEWSTVEVNGQTGYVNSEYLGTKITPSKYGIGLLKVGSKGASVSAVQTRLKELKYFNAEVTGYYGHMTRDAVAAFQEKNGLKADGIVGAEVREKLESASAVKKEPDRIPIEKIEWSKMNSVIPRGDNFTIMDVDTGKRFNVKRRGGSNHIDWEPLTSKDTATVKSIYGGSWSWNRRAVVVIYGGKAYAASINGMPHGGESIGSSNGFNGHACCHFYKSRTHGSGRVDSAHQAMVAKAASLGSITKKA
ncbi:MAG: peptidoglycan-binding protein [Clostridia bacterium]|nr:peptidoglycan-binding protein [Clostridia bacterium]